MSHSDQLTLQVQVLSITGLGEDDGYVIMTSHIRLNRSFIGF